MDFAGKKAARRSMGQAVPEHDIERLLDTARGPGAAAPAARAVPNEFSARLDRNRFGKRPPWPKPPGPIQSTPTHVRRPRGMG